MSQKWDCEKVREAFPALKEVVYLNTGTFGLMPEPALRSLLSALEEFERRGIASSLDLGAATEEPRKRIAALLNAQPEEIAFTRNAADSINLALAGLEWQEGDEVITTREEHPAMHHPLLYLQQRKGLRIRIVEVSPHKETMLESLEAASSSRTRLIAVSHVSSETGTRLPAAQICRWASSRGVLTLLDGAQAVGPVPVDVRQLGCDYYASNGHKWLGGPKGVGLFYGRLDRLCELTPAHIGAGSLERGDIDTGIAEPWKTGCRFEFGTRSWPLFAGLEASLEWLENLGWEWVRQHMSGLSDYLKEQIAARPYCRLLTPLAWEHSSGLTTFAVTGHSADHLYQTLRERWNIHVRVVPLYDAIRISTAHFNNQEDIDRLMSAVDKIVKE